MGKKEAVEYSRVNKKELARETRQLYKLLQRAKSERLEQDKVVGDLQGRLDAVNQQKDQAMKKYEMDRDIYARMLKEDRDNYGRKMQRAEQAIDEMKTEQTEAIDWAKSKQETYLKDTQELQTQLSAAKHEAVQQALEYNNVLANEIKELEAEVDQGDNAEESKADAKS